MLIKYCKLKFFHFENKHDNTWQFKALGEVTLGSRKSLEVSVTFLSFIEDLAGVFLAYPAGGVKVSQLPEGYQCFCKNQIDDC